MSTLKSSLLGAVALASLGGLSACQSYADSNAMPAHRMNPVQVSETVERLELYARPDGLVLSARDEAAVANFMREFAANGSGALHINRPSTGGHGVAQTDQMLNAAMRQAGLAPSAVQYGQFPARPGLPAPVVVSYRTLRTVPQNCNHMPNLTDTRHNTPVSSFGCFASANLAAMVSDPYQLLEPRTPDTPNAQRRQVIYDAYINGEGTAAQLPPRQNQSSQNTGG